MDFPEEGLWLIGRLSQNLMARNLVLGTVESCTGGLASVLCTNVPGASRWFGGCVVPYTNNLKHSILGVSKELIADHGAVSGPVAEAMAASALRVLGVSVSLAISGVAGPDGGSDDKPIGTVWIATAMYPRVSSISGAFPPPVVQSFCRQFPGMRDDVRFGAALAGIGAVDALLRLR
ncbi:CinA family protein [Desulfovibrio sp. OttesenSCG-928-M14]|nr:CinA family protein [Desulfovibrio sp. OttesenSCG-928-M14]